MNFLNDAAIRLGVWLSAAPTPAPFTGDEDLITPTWLGFAATLFVALATVVLIIDMNRRIRRTRYREEVRVKLEAEAQAEAAEAQARATKPAGD